MSVQNEITRITNDRNTIRNKLVNFGLVESSADLDDLATAVNGIANNGSPSAEVKEGETYTIQPGYYTGGSVQGVAGGGSYSLQSKTFTPTKSQTNVTPDEGYYGLSQVTVNAIPEAYQDVSSVTATASDVLATKSFVTSTGELTAGTMANNGAIDRTLDVNTTSTTIDQGYHNGTGTVKIVTETKTATPTTASQDITPTNGKVLSKVIVDAIPSNFGDATNADAIASNILTGKKAVVNVSGTATLITGAMANNGGVEETLDAGDTYTIPEGYHDGTGVIEATDLASQTVGDATAANILATKKAWVNGVQVTGSMANNGAVAATFTGLGAVAGDTSYTIPAGYHNGSGTVSLTSDIETSLAAI